MQPDLRGDDGGRVRRVLYSSGIGVLQRIAQVLATLICYPFLTRSLGTDQFGIWGAATSLVWLVQMLDFGVGGALVGLIPESIAGRGRGTPADLVGAALSFAVIRSFVMVAVGVGALLADHWRAGTPFLIAGVALAANIPAALAGRIWLSLQKAYVASAWDLIQTLSSGSLLIWGALDGWSTPALVGCVYVALVVANALSLTQLFLLHPEIRPSIRLNFIASRTLVARSAPMLGITVAAIAGWAFDNVLCLVWLGAAAAAQMAIALRLCTTAQGVIDTIGQTLWPAFADASHDRRWILKALLRGTALLTFISVVGATTVALVGRPLLRLWLGRDLGVEWPTLWAIGAWVGAYAIVQAPFYLLLAVSKLKALFIALAVAAVAGIAIKAMLAPRFGPAGMLFATATLNLTVVLPTVVWATWAWFRSATPQIVTASV